MTFDDQMRDHRSRCQRQLSRLQMLTLGQDGMVSPSRIAAEIRSATNAIIAETEAMSRAVLRAGRQEPGAETFLWVRVTRLALAADQAVMAASSGDIHELRTHLHHFDTLTSAILTVQNAVHGRQPTIGRDSPATPRPAAGWPQIPPPRVPR
jgi:hypothetical protein